MTEIVMYTDGSYDPRTGDGGYAASLYCGDQNLNVVGGEHNTTNNRMELLAVIAGLSKLQVPCIVNLFADSQYVLNGISQWLSSWKRNNWMTKSGPVVNQDLWIELDKLLAIHQVRCNWVKGHAGHGPNEAVDSMAMAYRCYHL